MQERLEPRRLFAGPDITDFSLMNAIADRPVDGYLHLSDAETAAGETIDLADLPTRKISVRANVNDAASVRFGLDGNNSYRTESFAPFVLMGDTRGDIYSWTPSVGTHTISATAYTGANATGEAGPTKTIRLNIVDSGGGGGSADPAPEPEPEPEPTPSPSPAPTRSEDPVSGSSGVPQPVNGGQTIVVDPNGSVKTIARAAELAEPGDVVLIRAGTYREQIKLTRSGTSSAPITFAAESLGSVTLDGNGRDYIIRGEADYIRLTNLKFDNADNDMDSAALQVIGRHWRLTDLIVEDSQGQGVVIHGDGARLLRVTARRNGQEGIAGADVQDVIVKDSVLHDNNVGIEDPDWAGRQWTERVDGKWYVQAHYQAGGGKWVRSNNITIDGVHSYENHGTGVWFDGDNTNITIKNSHIHDNRPISHFFEGVGISIEVNRDGPFLIENNRVENNVGGNIVIASSQHVTVRNNTIVGEYVALNDWDRGEDWRLWDIEFTENTFNDSFLWTGGEWWNENTGDDRQILFDRNAYDRAADVIFKWGGRDYRTINDVRNRLDLEWNGWEVR